MHIHTVTIKDPPMGTTRSTEINVISKLAFSFFYVMTNSLCGSAISKVNSSNSNQSIGARNKIVSQSISFRTFDVLMKFLRLTKIASQYENIWLMLSGTETNNPKK